MSKWFSEEQTILAFVETLFLWLEKVVADVITFHTHVSTSTAIRLFRCNKRLGE